MGIVRQEEPDAIARKDAAGDIQTMFGVSREGQALAVVMRELTLHEISLSHWRRVLGKETLVGLLNGLGVALTSALVVYVWSGSLGLNCAADVGALWSGPGAVVVDHSDHYHRYRRLLQFSQHCQLAGGNHLVCDKLSRRLARSGHVPGHRDTSRCL